MNCAEAVQATAVTHVTPQPPITVSHQEWSPVESRKQRRVRLRVSKVVGKDATEGTHGTTVRGVPRRTVLAVFVGRLHKDMTPEDLTAYLTAEGRKGVTCRKLKPKVGQKFHTAAFYVSCCHKSRDTFYDESRRPEWAELRDWVYK